MAPSHATGRGRNLVTPVQCVICCIENCLTCPTHNLSPRLPETRGVALRRGRLPLAPRRVPGGNKLRREVVAGV